MFFARLHCWLLRAQFCCHLLAGNVAYEINEYVLFKVCYQEEAIK